MKYSLTVVVLLLLLFSEKAMSQYTSDSLNQPIKSLSEKPKNTPQLAAWDELGRL